MDDEDLFDDDKALDFIMSEEVDKVHLRESGISGCLGVFVLLILPQAVSCAGLSFFINGFGM